MTVFRKRNHSLRDDNLTRMLKAWNLQYSIKECSLYELRIESVIDDYLIHVPKAFPAQPDAVYSLVLAGQEICQNN